ncbi:MAG: SDR family oxidoreductase [Elusimicrobiota bacterium]
MDPRPPLRLEGRAALVTGASQGLGRAIAARFAAEGADLVLCARTARALEEAREELAGALAPGRRLVTVAADVSKGEDVERLAKTALEEFPDLGVIVNNAGVYGTFGPLEEVDWSDWVRTIEVNLLGPALVCRAFLPHLKRRRGGKIINLSGGGATAPMPRISAYAASKAALVRMTETLAEETRGLGIDVNAVAPGAMNTRMLEQALAAGPELLGAKVHERLLKQKKEGGVPPAKAAALCAFLASAESDGITGKLLSAVWDPWAELPGRRKELETDIYTLRRIVPKDRGMNWGG